MSRRYVLHPGLVKYSPDGASHFVSASTLARLYGVEMRDCIVFDPSPCNRTENYDDCIHLHPRTDENYATPQLEQVACHGDEIQGRSV